MGKGIKEGEGSSSHDDDLSLTMKARGTPVKFIRCDNSGENRDLKTKVEQSNDLNNITFEFTARDNPQPNGKIEKRFDIIFNRVRANFEAAKLSRVLRNKLWAEACMTAIDIENLIVHARHENPSYREFFKKDMPRAEERSSLERWEY